MSKSTKTTSAGKPAKPNLDFAKEANLMGHEVAYGPEFRKPSRKNTRKARNHTVRTNGKRMFEAGELGDKFVEAYNDPDLLSHRKYAAIFDVRVRQLCERLYTGEPSVADSRVVKVQEFEFAKHLDMHQAGISDVGIHQADNIRMPRAVATDDTAARSFECRDRVLLGFYRYPRLAVSLLTLPRGIFRTSYQYDKKIAVIRP